MSAGVHALVVGAGSGLSASIARLFSRSGMRVSLAARDTAKLRDLGCGISAQVFACDASDAGSVEALFRGLDASAYGAPAVVVYNPSYRVRGPLLELDPAEVERTLRVTALGGFHVAQQAVRRMLPQGRGVLLFTGASASVKGYAQSAPFAMGKFALRGLAQSLAREFQPLGIHACHVVIDGGIRSASRREAEDRPDSLLDPDAIAETYLHLVNQPRSAWTFELELRPWVERF